MPGSYQEPIDEGDLNLESKFVKPKKEMPRGDLGTDSSRVEKEMPKEVLKAEKDSAYNRILSKIKTPSSVQPGDSDVKVDAKEAFEKTDAEGKVQHLVNVAMNKGVIHAVRVARHMEDNYALDMFHDRLLSEELYEALVNKGLIDKV